MAGKTRDIESLDLTTFSGRLYKEIILKFSSAYNFAKVSGLNLRDIQQYLSGKYKPTFDKLLEFKNAGLDINYIIDGDGTKKPLMAKRFFNTVAAGVNHCILNEDYDLVEIPVQLSEFYKNPIVFTVQGDSMLPKFSDGDMLICEHTDELKHNSYTVCIHNGNGLFKQVIISDSGIILHSLNPDYEDIVVKKKDKLKVLGILVHLIATVRYD